MANAISFVLGVALLVIVMIASVMWALEELKLLWLLCESERAGGMDNVNLAKAPWYVRYYDFLTREK